MKAQIAVDADSLSIISTHFCSGRVHDFQLFKKSRILFSQDTLIAVDTGYLGIAKRYTNILMPKKRTKLHPLTDEEKKANRAISSKRIFIEHVIGALKRFRIISDRYRNRRKRFALRFNLIAAIYNAELKLRKRDI